RYTLDGSDPTETSNIYYGNPLVISGVSSEITLKAKAFKSGYSSSDSTSDSYVFTLPEVSFNPVGGEYSNSIGLYLSQPVTGAVIRYALNGDIPTETTGTIFSGAPVSVANGTVVKAIAYKSGWKTSQVKSQTYFLKLNKPIFITDSSKVYNSPVRVRIEVVPKSAKIKYTLDGSDPKTSSSAKEYASPIEVSSETTIKCYSLKEGWNDSEVEEKTYKFQ
ncbi:MAG TPA: chitobiase/beta-hexosaminidase C-terminal domain-containing protein, partial [Spirochaetota bacterium]|nr:chitobiase/beta-hexosaminidase C-terminal domain-containing protein [Spirochaetota bacterium]